MRRLLMLAILVLAGAVTAAQPAEYTYQARVHVTAEGVVEAVVPEEGMITQVATLVANAVSAHTFTPATVNGVPAASKTTVWVKARFEPVAGDASGQQLAARILGVSQANPFVRPAAYPAEAMRAGIQAKVWLEVVLRPDGTVDPVLSRVAQADIRAADGRKVARSRHGKEISAAALASVQAWRMFPEEVAGVVQPTRQITAMTFCVSSRPSPRVGCPAFDSGPEEAPRYAADPAVNLARLLDPEASPDA